MSVQAFELCPLLTEDSLEFQDADITSFELCGDILFVGTAQGLLLQFLVTKQELPGERYFFSSERINGREIAQRKPIYDLHCASAIGRLVCLVDGSLLVVSMETMGQTGQSGKIRNITCLAVNEAPLNSNPLALELCIALRARRHLLIVVVTADKVSTLKQITVPESPQALSIDGSSLCMGLQSTYLMQDVATNSRLELFPFNAEVTVPFVRKIGSGEFLLNGPNALGIFVTSAGMSQKPPLKWSDTTFAVAFYHPYILALDEEFLTVHSILDQIQKQSIPSPDWRLLRDSEGTVIVGRNRDLMVAAPMSVEKQISNLISERREEEAFTLLRSHALSSSKHPPSFYDFRLVVIQHAGFIKLHKKQYEAASSLLKEAETDLRLVINLSSELNWIVQTLEPSWSSPLDWKWYQTLPLLPHPPEEDFPSDSGISEEGNNGCTSFLTFLVDLILDLKREGKLSLELMAESCLLYLLPPHYPERLNKLLEARLLPAFSTAQLPFLKEDSPEGQVWLKLKSRLTSNNRHHTLALFLSQHSLTTALDIWKQLENGTLIDKFYPGVSVFEHHLVTQGSVELVWAHLPWLLSTHPGVALRVLLHQQPSDSFRPLEVAQFLIKFPSTRLQYLEHQVNVALTQEADLHTDLAMVYLEKIIQCDESRQAELVDTRQKFFAHLSSSSLVRIEPLTNLIEGKPFHIERCHLLAKRGLHKEALTIYIDTLDDFPAAMRYCKVNRAALDVSGVQHLYGFLLLLLLKPTSAHPNGRIALVRQLLDSTEADIDPAFAVEHIPDSWGLSILSGFLSRSISRKLSRSHEASLRRSFTRCSRSRLAGLEGASKATAVKLDDTRVCSVCQGPFFEPFNFVVYPNGTLAHESCIVSCHVCPRTGNIFHYNNLASSPERSLSRVDNVSRPRADLANKSRSPIRHFAANRPSPNHTNRPQSDFPDR